LAAKTARNRPSTVEDRSRVLHSTDEIDKGFSRQNVRQISTIRDEICLIRLGKSG